MISFLCFWPREVREKLLFQQKLSKSSEIQKILRIFGHVLCRRIVVYDRIKPRGAPAGVGGPCLSAHTAAFLSAVSLKTLRPRGAPETCVDLVSVPLLL